MQIVINIPDLVYESIIVGAETSRDVADVLFAIRQGTVLPKGHGDLIDKDKLSHIYRQMSYCSTAPNFIWVSELMKVTPIIEADKEDKDADSD